MKYTLAGHSRFMKYTLAGFWALRLHLWGSSTTSLPLLISPGPAKVSNFFVRVQLTSILFDLAWIRKSVQLLRESPAHLILFDLAWIRKSVQLLRKSPAQSPPSSWSRLDPRKCLTKSLLRESPAHLPPLSLAWTLFDCWLVVAVVLFIHGPGMADFTGSLLIPVVNPLRY